MPLITSNIHTVHCTWNTADDELGGQGGSERTEDTHLLPTGGSVREATSVHIDTQVSLPRLVSYSALRPVYRRL